MTYKQGKNIIDSIFEATARGRLNASITTFLIKRLLKNQLDEAVQYEL